MRTAVGRPSPRPGSKSEHAATDDSWKLRMLSDACRPLATTHASVIRGSVELEL